MLSYITVWHQFGIFRSKPKYLIQKGKKVKVTFMPIYVAVTGSQASGATLKMEMSQEGFRAAYLPGVI